MKISNDRKLKELQKDFQEVFPFLKMEFYRKAHEIGEESPEEDRYDLELKIGAIRQLQNVGFVALDEDLSTGDFEKILKDQFGLNVQIFRKSYHEWLQTWATDNWSLKEQNRRGSIMGEKGKTLAQIKAKTSS